MYECFLAFGKVERYVFTSPMDETEDAKNYYVF